MARHVPTLGWKLEGDLQIKMAPELTPNEKGKRLVIKKGSNSIKLPHLNNAVLYGVGISCDKESVHLFCEQVGKSTILFTVPIQDFDESIGLIHCAYYDFGSLNFLSQLSLLKLGEHWFFRVIPKFGEYRWKKLWSIQGLLLELKIIFDELIVEDLLSQKSHINEKYRMFLSESNTEAIFDFSIVDLNTTLQEQIDIFEPKFLQYSLEAERRLQAKLDENALISHFKFHPAFQGACEEYLWSFIQFLRDMGVEAEGKLQQDKEHPGQVLFAVTPAKGKEALGKIQKALDLYIALAGVTNFELDENASLQIERLQIRIERFQTDLRMAKLELRTQAAEIRAQETIEYGLTKDLENVTAMNVFYKDRVEQLEKEKKLKKELELFDGWFMVENPKFMGVKFNLAEAWLVWKRYLIEEIPPELPPSPERPALPLAPED